MKKTKPWLLLTGLAVLLVFVLAAAFPGLFTSYGRKEMFAPWLKPCTGHLLGTNALGYDIFTELIFGARQTLLTGISSSILMMLLGAGIGILASGKSWLSSISGGLIHIFIMLPKLVCLIVLSAFLGSSTWNLIALIALFSWVGTARTVRAKVIHLQAQPFVENCVIQGFRPARIAVFHLLPNLSDVLLSRFLLGINSCIMMESTLSFLGFGDLYHATWGTMMNFAYRRGALIRQAYGYLLAPGLCIAVLSLSFYAIGLYFEKRQNVIPES